MKRDLPTHHIAYLEADQNYTIIHYRDGSQATHGYSLKVFEEKLTPTCNFRRIHRKYLVNDNFVKRKLYSSVLMKSGVELPVSRRRR